MRVVRNLLFIILLLLCQSAWAAKGTLLFVPLDNRPVCLDYTVQTMEAAGWEVKTPPREYIASEKNMGEPEKMLAWLEENAPEAVGIVASSDALIYGGLVASRTHEIPLEVLQERAQRLIDFRRNYGGQKHIYLFATIMRSPKASSAPVEPAYYKEWGPKLFRLGALEDKRELKLLKRREAKELAALREEIPGEIVTDLYERRNKNILTTELLLHGVESGDFDYFLIGRDDTAPFSQAHREARSMEILVSELPKERIRFFAGADQLGLVLLTRAAKRLQYELPMVNVTYAAGAGGKTVPSYEDDTVAESAKQHIYAAGAFPVRLRKHADVVLAVNTPKNGKTLEASNAVNNYKVPAETKNFASKVARLSEYYPVALADVKFGNGADNALVKTLFAKKLAYKLAAYGGWNTAGNSLGFALGQGLMSNEYAPGAKKVLLNQRYLDDWAYQANVRMQTYTQLIWPNYWPNSGLEGEQLAQAEAFITKEMVQLAEPYLGEAVRAYRYTLPWKRMFEVQISKK
ncbi:MAG: DUF4127 family protein [Phascolarctobacterium sp.]